MKKKKVLVAMSGGVDSSVAAKLLKDAGYEVAGIFLHFWKDEQVGREAENKCCSLKALTDARRVCAKIGIPLYTMNFAEVFKREVVDYFLGSYAAGATPNPCVRCNKFVKLGLLVKKARRLGFDYVASGHYVKNVKCQMPARNASRSDAGGSNVKCIYKLQKAKDQEKDQSYFLYTFNQEELSRLLFPLGDYTKSEVRQMAKKFKLPVVEKKESQEICFIPGKSHNDFLGRHLKLRGGPIKTMSGKKIGMHRGLPLYTVGQRKGVEIGGSGPYYVASQDYKTNTLYVVKDGDDPVLHGDKLFAADVNWIAGKAPKFPLKCEAVIRYRHKPIKCTIAKPHPNPLLSKERGLNLYLVKLSTPQRAITPGQSVVFYKGKEVLGGGIIHRG